MLKNWGPRSTFWSSDVEKLHAAVAKRKFASENVKNCGSGATFWSSDVEKLYAAVAKSVLWSQNVKKLWVWGHFLKFGCRKIARRYGEKHIMKSKCWKTVGLGPLFEVRMSKNCTPLWRKAHYEVKMLKNCGSGATFWSSDVEKLHAAVAKSTLWSQNVKKLRCSEHLFKFCCPMSKN